MLIQKLLYASLEVSKGMLENGFQTCKMADLDQSWETTDVHRVSKMYLLSCQKYKPYALKLDIHFYDVINDDLVPMKVCENPSELIPSDWDQEIENGHACHIAPDFILVGMPQRTPKSLVYPLAYCKMFREDVACPRDSPAYLRHAIIAGEHDKSKKGI